MSDGSIQQRPSPGSRRIVPWVVWGSLSAVAVVALGMRITAKEADRALFLPGETTQGHYQIELACNECHQAGFSDAQVLQSACERCHAAELKMAEDSHPGAKFRDPRNAARVALLDARLCVTCHQEHKPELTHSMGLSLPEDYCYRCHQEIGDERPSHRGLSFDTCASAGCHNFHDNRALYEDFLAQHAGEAQTLNPAMLPALPRPKPASAKPFLVPPGKALSEAEQQAFSSSAHGVSGMHCGKCHNQNGQWQTRPDAETCAGCHDQQVAGWKRGRHGMRVGSGLSPMVAANARLPMKPAAAHQLLDCGSCHKSHAFDTAFAAAEACQTCHDDEHTRNYVGSPHERLWRAELSGEVPAGHGVSCATCHLPRVGAEKIHVEHNQNDTLRPNEKMVRPVCGNCHGIGFAMDALADAELIRKNFAGKPARHVTSIDWAVARAKRE